MGNPADTGSKKKLLGHSPNATTKEKGKLMYLDTGTLIGLTIALASSCFVMVVSIRAQGKLLRENKELRKELTELHYEKVRGWN